mmetsp:Transcript_23292/g.59695  ORF Transcript_23292/g.59695 Transcript_23292/m.59695 type:complete len:214 (+) Transcript_23292:495-1136(+)
MRAKPAKDAALASAKQPRGLHCHGRCAEGGRADACDGHRVHKERHGGAAQPRAYAQVAHHGHRAAQGGQVAGQADRVPRVRPPPHGQHRRARDAQHGAGHLSPRDRAAEAQRGGGQQHGRCGHQQQRVRERGVLDPPHPGAKVRRQAQPTTTQQPHRGLRLRAPHRPQPAPLHHRARKQEQGGQLQPPRRQQQSRHSGHGVKHRRGGRHRRHP